MTADETLVKERFDIAVGGLSPDTVSLVGGGVAVGRGIRRRRRLAGAGTAATAAVVTGVLLASGGLGSFFDSQGADPANRTLTQSEPATPRGLAAALLTHTDGLGTPIVVGGDRLDNGDPGLEAGLGYKVADGVRVELKVVASAKTAKFRNKGICASATADLRCTEVTLPDGTKRAVFEATSHAGKGSREQDTYSLVGVAVLRADQFILVSETTVGRADSPLDVADLEAIAADPAVGMNTTAELNAKGLEIPDFKSSLSTTTSSSSSSGSGSAGPPQKAPNPRQNGSPVSSSAATPR